MKARQAVLEAKVNAEAQNARQNCQRDKRTALAALKRRRSYQVLRSTHLVLQQQQQLEIEKRSARGQTQQSKTEEMRVAFEAQLSAIESSNHVCGLPPQLIFCCFLFRLTLVRHRTKRSWSWPASHWRQLLRAAQGVGLIARTALGSDQLTSTSAA
jgi:hypothetical protein